MFAKRYGSFINIAPVDRLKIDDLRDLPLKADPEPRDLALVDDNRRRSFGGFRKREAIMDRRWS